MCSVKLLFATRNKREVRFVPLGEHKNAVHVLPGTTWWDPRQGHKYNALYLGSTLADLSAHEQIALSCAHPHQERLRLIKSPEVFEHIIQPRASNLLPIQQLKKLISRPNMVFLSVWTKLLDFQGNQDGCPEAHEKPGCHYWWNTVVTVLSNWLIKVVCAIQKEFFNPNLEVAPHRLSI